MSRRCGDQRDELAGSAVLFNTFQRKPTDQNWCASAVLCDLLILHLDLQRAIGEETDYTLPVLQERARHFALGCMMFGVARAKRGSLKAAVAPRKALRLRAGRAPPRGSTLLRRQSRSCFEKPSGPRQLTQQRHANAQVHARVAQKQTSKQTQKRKHTCPHTYTPTPAPPRTRTPARTRTRRRAHAHPGAPTRAAHTQTRRHPILNIV